MPSFLTSKSMGILRTSLISPSVGFGFSEEVVLVVELDSVVVAVPVEDEEVSDALPVFLLSPRKFLTPSTTPPFCSSSSGST